MRNVYVFYYKLQFLRPKSKKKTQPLNGKLKNAGKDKINLSKLRELREYSNNVQEFKMYLKLSINYNLQLDSQVIWKLQVNKIRKKSKISKR